jgi:hypothetical protein
MPISFLSKTKISEWNPANNLSRSRHNNCTATIWTTPNWPEDVSVMEQAHLSEGDWILNSNTGVRVTQIHYFGTNITK